MTSQRQSDHVDPFAIAHDCGIRLSHVEATILMAIDNAARDLGLDSRKASPQDCQAIANAMGIAGRAIDSATVASLIAKGGF